MNFSLYIEASRLEKNNPSKSLELYSELERKNKEFHFKYVIFGIFLPVFAFILAAWFSRSYEMSDFLVTLFVWIGIGFIPNYIMSVRRFEKIRGFTEKERFQKLRMPKSSYYFHVYFLIPLIGYLAPSVIFIFVAAITCIVVAILHGAAAYIYHLITRVPFKNVHTDLFQYVTAPVMVAAFIIVFFLLASDVPFKHIFSLRKILIGIKVNLKNIMLCFQSLLILLILGGGSMGIFYEWIFYGILISTVTGIISGLTDAWCEKDWILGKILKLAKIRCLIYSGRKIEAKYYLNYVEMEKNHPKEIQEILYVMDRFFSKDDTEQIRDYLQNISIGSDDRYQKIYKHNIQLIKDLLDYR